MDDKDRAEVEKIITEKIGKALLSGGLISNSMDERLAYVGKDVYIIKNNIKKLREDLDRHFERHLRALERRKQEGKK